MIRVLHIGLSDSLGGIESYLYKIARHIDREKYQFDFLVYEGFKPCFQDELMQLGCRFYSVTSRHQNFFKNRHEIRQLYSNTHFDIVHCHLNTLSDIFLANAAWCAGFNVIVHSRSSGNPKMAFVTRMLHQLNSRLFRKGRFTLAAVSELAAVWMFGEDADVTILNNGVDIMVIHFSEEKRLDVRKEFCIGDEKVIVHIGRFQKEKNHDFLLDVFYYYSKMETDSKLLLVGIGPLQAEIKKKAARLGLLDHVIFTGARTDVAALLSAGDCFLFPSFLEGFPNALIEAEACGLPCLASDTITKEVVSDELCTLMPLSASPEAWAKKLLSFNPLLDRSKGSRIIKRMKLDVDSEIKRLCEFYDNILC
jgi:glycosyltransferase involved in cell wall biosynthesis